MTPSIAQNTLTFSPPWATRDDWHGWSRAHWQGTLIAVAAVLIALLLQITVLSGWHLGAPISALQLNPVNTGVTKNSSGDLVYAFKGEAAVAATGSISVGTSQMLAITVDVNRVPDQTSLTVGWLSTRDLKRPPSLLVRLPATNLPAQYTVLLRGHPQWQDNVAQIAVALTAPTGSGAVTVSNVEIVPATPLSSVALAAQEWFGNNTLLSPTKTTERILPLALWLSFAAVLSVLGIVWVSGRAAKIRIQMLVGAAIALGLIAFFSALIAPTPFRFSSAAVAWIASALAICACASPWHAVLAQISDEVPEQLQTFVKRYDFKLALAFALLFAALAILLGGQGMIWIAPVVVFLLLARRAPELMRRLLPLLFFLPIVLAGAVLHGAVPWPELATSLRGALSDPSATLAGLVSRGAGIPAFLIGAFVAHRAWPSAPDAPRFSAIAGLATWYVLLGITFAMAVPAVARQLAAGTGAVWVILPLIASVALLLAPAFKTRSEVADVKVVEQKTEHDLSDVVRSLFDGALGSFDQAVIGERTGGALAPLMRMREIAPASLITHAANLRYALATNDLPRAADSYALLKAKTIEELPAKACEAMVQYAHGTSDFATVLSHAKALPPSAPLTRIVAYTQLMNTGKDDAEAGRQVAIATLMAHPEPREFAREITELHLIAHEWELAQKSLALSGIEIESLPGQTYVSRLGMRAVGPQNYRTAVEKNAVWHPGLGVVQAAMGDLLLAQGNAVGARARYLLARKLDAGLWPLEALIRNIEKQISDTTNADPAATGTNAESNASSASVM
jgi:hypothetical protein